MRFSRCVVATACLVLILTGCKTPRSVTELSDEAIVQNFRTIVFYRKFAPGA
mgnify:FL=1|tara:strand:+ start:6270 stop:6425 length:156 start_codon:yes stop_codon:yes gene_type:complete